MDLSDVELHRIAAEVDKMADSVILDESDTGAKKHRKGKLRIDLIPPEVTKALAEGFTLGVDKGYGADNWAKGLLMCEDSLAAAKRHILAWELGTDLNVEYSPDGRKLTINHMTAALVNIAMIVTQIMRNREDLDDRRSKKKE